MARLGLAVYQPFPTNKGQILYIFLKLLCKIYTHTLPLNKNRLPVHACMKVRTKSQLFSTKSPNVAI